jgi:hypothetical protein
MTSDESDPNATSGTEPLGERAAAPAGSPPPAAPTPPPAPGAGPAQPPPPAPAPPPAQATGPAYPFVPRYREPWINPAKRTPAVLLGVAGAAVALLLGLLIGLGIGGGHGRAVGPRFEMRGPYAYQQPGHGYGMWRFRHPGYGPRFGRPPGARRPPVSPSAPTPSPVPSSSHR